MSGRAGRKPSTPRGLAGPKAEKTISLALQGGGAHGAFTWGVLDQLIEDGRLAIEAITGASAGSMNAVVLVDGWREGGPDGARESCASSGSGSASTACCRRCSARSSTNSSASGAP